MHTSRQFTFYYPTCTSYYAHSPLRVRFTSPTPTSDTELPARRTIPTPLPNLKKQTRTHLTNRTATTQREHRTMHTHPFESDSLLLLRRAIQTSTWMADGRTSKRLSTLTASQRSRYANKVNADRWIDCLRFPKEPTKATSKRR
ncbi:hypothetical protein GN958_ATG02598 [Phytophthora infestans]|uniref:Uncharacterized protein n=1 Tax=Phytophthora infestans TaxID=4787 RepID=A0A8S9VA29_PHYIN|nr:hypothetical protein GN958_ATG02598 [Phytophthora infestans]